MNVLLVDDDRFVVAALQKKIQWDSLTVTEVFTAYNIRQAQKVMENHTVDICVCDIEMPGGSGLDLLAWVRQQEFNTQFIFLTSYADFTYAQKAISLSSLDYQLKPIDFTSLYEILEKAAEKVRNNAALSKTKANSEHWHENYQTIVNLFWKDLFENPLMKDSSVLEKKLLKSALSYKCSDSFLPVLLKLYPDTGLLQEMDQPMIDFSFQNITSETLEDSCILYEALVCGESFEYILILGSINLEEVRLPLTETFKNLFQNLNSFLKCDISCCISEEVPMNHLPDIVRELRNMRENNLSQVNIPLFLSDYTPKEVSYTPPSLEVISTFLQQKNAEAALQKLEHYLLLLSSRKQVNKDVLTRLRLDTEQMVFSYLQANGIEAHTLFSTEENNLLLSKSTESVPYMLDYLKHLMTRAVDYSSFIDEEHSVIDIILNHIHQHYQEDITRTMLADMVFLNPDYMARLFKKETHTSLINYITEYRMQKAKEFLTNPDIPVGTVASKVGYGNYSYFSKIFKETTGVSPNEYRKKLSQDSEL